MSPIRSRALQETGAANTVDEGTSEGRRSFSEIPVDDDIPTVKLQHSRSME